MLPFNIHRIQSSVLIRTVNVIVKNCLLAEIKQRACLIQIYFPFQLFFQLHQQRTIYEDLGDPDCSGPKELRRCLSGISPA